MTSQELRRKIMLFDNIPTETLSMKRTLNMRRNTSKSAKSALTNTYTHNSLNQLVGRDVPSNGNFYFPAYDNNGNITMYIDESSNVIAAYEYDDFGRLISATGQMADFFRIRFSTKYYDLETGLYYCGYRFYSPQLMRWLTRDPIEEEGGLNLYGFCRNLPMSAYDPFGLERITLRYDTDYGTVLDRASNFATVYGLNSSQIAKDIIERTTPYSPNGKGKCKCASYVIIAGHGSQGQIFLDERGDETIAAKWIRDHMSGIESRFAPKASMELLDSIKSRLCERATVEFVTCYSGEGIAGADLRDALKDFFGDHVQIILYENGVAYYFNTALRGRKR